MTLLVNVLNGTLFQELTATKNHDVIAVRPHIVRVGNPAGTLKVRISDEFGRLINESSSVNISTIGTLNNFHGYVQFDVNAPVKLGAKIRVELVGGGGYSATDSTYIGWNLDYDLRRYTATYTPNTGKDSPHDVELWQKRTIGMVRELDFADGFESSQAPVGDTQFNLTNNQASPANVTGLLFTATDNEHVTVGYSIYRTDGATEKRESGTLKLQYKPVGAAWAISRETEGDLDVGVTLSVTSGGQVQYVSDDFTGQTIGYIKFSVNERFTPGV